jgi:hypothetical protein
MAGVSDKARFFLEQSIPELKEYERKKIFSSVCCPIMQLEFWTPLIGFRMRYPVLPGNDRISNTK